jgi:nitrite reductase/ring-hydroxylating ferredoxin subunit/uncharacterized membrane protein
MSVLERAVDVAARQRQLDSLADALQRRIRAAYGAGGAVGRRVQDVLHGTWLGHPLHSALTDVPIGAWSTGVALDVLGSRRRQPGMEQAADTAIGLGIAGALAAAIAGLTDWQHTDGEARRTGLLHALGNTVALGLFTSSWLLRKGGLRSGGRATALAGLGALLVSAYLGGRLVYRHRIGVSHADPEAGPRRFVDVLRDSDLAEGELRRVEADGTPIVLVRQTGKIFALDARCSHLGGPLDEGRLLDDSVRCPWHGSRFALKDGRVLDGPAVVPQPCFDTRVRGGRIEVRRRPD